MHFNWIKEKDVICCEHRFTKNMSGAPKQSFTEVKRVHWRKLVKNLGINESALHILRDRMRFGVNLFKYLHWYVLRCVEKCAQKFLKHSVMFELRAKIKCIKIVSNFYTQNITLHKKSIGLYLELKFISDSTLINSKTLF